MILKTEAKVRPASSMHWNCVRSKQVVFKCSDVATFDQNHDSNAFNGSQGARHEHVYTFHIKKETPIDQVLLTLSVLLSRLCC